MADLTREQVVALGRDALAAAAVAETSGLPEETSRAQIYKQFAGMCAQLARLMAATGAGLKGVQIWTTVEQFLAREKGTAGVVVVIVPRAGAAGAGIGLFKLVEAAGLMLPESRRAFFAQIAAAAYETAVAQAEVGPQNPNGDEGARGV